MFQVLSLRQPGAGLGEPADGITTLQADQRPGGEAWGEDEGGGAYAERAQDGQGVSAEAWPHAEGA